jgi:hypothetical protein
MKETNETSAPKNDYREDFEIGVVFTLFIGMLGLATVFGVCC